jgi:hypothetical protein
VGQRFEQRHAETFEQRSLHDSAAFAQQPGLLVLGDVVGRRADEADAGKVGAALRGERVRGADAVAVLARPVVAEHEERAGARRGLPRGGQRRAVRDPVQLGPVAEQARRRVERPGRRRDHGGRGTQRQARRHGPPPRRAFAGLGVQPRQVVHRRDRRARRAQRHGGDRTVQHAGPESAQQSRQLPLAGERAARRRQTRHAGGQQAEVIDRDEHGEVAAGELAVGLEAVEEGAADARDRTVAEAGAVEHDPHRATPR